ncbi:MAG TPA: sulfatase, partial [Longimicrobium sp.]|nr:sulfatase [Longimicrobium sp.]
MRILYLDIDSLRPDHLGCYGYHRDTSPHIDRIAREGVRFNQCYAPDAPCLPSRTAFYTGRFGIQTGVVGHGGTAAEPKVEGKLRGFRDRIEGQGLARQLQNLGFHTAMISPFGQRHAAHWFYAGFHEIHNTGAGGMESAEEVWPVVERWLEGNAARDNWYLHLNFWDPHTPYRVPAEYGDPFAQAPLPAWLDDAEILPRHSRKTGPHSSLDISMYDDRE